MVYNMLYRAIPGRTETLFPVLILLCLCTRVVDVSAFSNSVQANVVFPAGEAGDSAGIVAESFNPEAGGVITLAQAITRALAANRNVAEAGDQLLSAGLAGDVAQADFELLIAPGWYAGFAGESASNRIEQIGAHLTLRKKFITGTEVAVEPSVAKVGDRYTSVLGSRFRQPLLRGLSRDFNRSGIYEAEFQERAAHRAVHLTCVQTIIATVNAAYEAARQRETITILDAFTARLRNHAEAAEIKERMGMTSPIDTYRALIQLKLFESSLAMAHEAYGDALDELRTILALPFDVPLTVNVPLEFSMPDIEEEAAQELALAKRVEIIHALDAIDEARRRSKTARHNTLPELDLVAFYARSGDGEDISGSMNLSENQWGLRFESSTDLRRTAEHAAFKQSLLQLNSAGRGLESRRDQIIREVQIQLRSLRRLHAQIAIAKEQIEQAEGKMELALLKFNHGIAGNFDLIEAERELQNAQINLLSTVTESIIGEYRLRAAMGTLLEYHEERI